MDQWFNLYMMTFTTCIHAAVRKYLEIHLGRTKVLDQPRSFKSSHSFCDEDSTEHYCVAHFEEMHLLEEMRAEQRARIRASSK